MTTTPRTAAAYFTDPARLPLAGLVVGVGSLLAALELGGARGFATAYLPAWLALLALPVGALPVVIMIERADAWRPQPETALLGTLRGLLALMPVAAILALPLLPNLAVLYPWARGEGLGALAAANWFTLPFFMVRLALALAVWTLLAILFATRGGEPWGKAGRIDDGRAILGLGLHMVFGTLAALDLVVAISADHRPGLLTLVTIASWSALSLSAAILVAPPDIGPSRRRLDRLTPLAVLLAIWAFLHLVLYIVATGPAAARWYAMRFDGEGMTLAIAACTLVVVAALVLLRPGEYLTRVVAACALVVQFLALAWLVTPALRGSFKLTPLDGLALAGITGLATFLAPTARRLFPGVPTLRPGPRRKTGSA